MYFLPVQNNNINNKKINDITKAFIINKNARTDRVQSTRLVLSLPLSQFHFSQQYRQID